MAPFLLLSGNLDVILFTFSILQTTVIPLVRKTGERESLLTHLSINLWRCLLLFFTSLIRALLHLCLPLMGIPDRIGPTQINQDNLLISGSADEQFHLQSQFPFAR